MLIRAKLNAERFVADADAVEVDVVNVADDYDALDRWPTVEQPPRYRSVGVVAAVTA